MSEEKVLIYTKNYCPYCVAVKNLFKNMNIPYTEINIENDPDFYDKLRKETGHMTVPQIFIQKKFIGGYDDVKALQDSGELLKLL